MSITKELHDARNDLGLIRIVAEKYREFVRARLRILTKEEREEFQKLDSILDRHIRKEKR